MPSTPTYKNLDALVELPESRQLEAAEAVTETRIYAAKYSVCRAAVKAKGTAGTGDLEGFIISRSIVTRSKGELGRLTDSWTAGGPDGDPGTTPLPPDEFSLQSQDLNPSVEKNIGFEAAVTDATRYNSDGDTGTSEAHKTLLAWVRQAGLLADDGSTNVAWNALVGFVSTPGGDKFEQALVLADLLRRGIQNYYQASFVYTWSQYYFSEPTISEGGFSESPGGPLASAISGLGLSCLRQADDLDPWNGLGYRLTNKWICARADFWEPVLYP